MIFHQALHLKNQCFLFWLFEASTMVRAKVIEIRRKHVYIHSNASFYTKKQCNLTLKSSSALAKEGLDLLVSALQNEYKGIIYKIY